MSHRAKTVELYKTVIKKKIYDVRYSKCHFHFSTLNLSFILVLLTLTYVLILNNFTFLMFNGTQWYFSDHFSIYFLFIFQLLHLGRDYPKGYEYFRTNLKKVFLKNKNESDPEKIEKMIARGNFVVKELEALYMLRKYRTLKKRYYDQ